jgi:mannose/fructose/N-acetylgalactosamine-specific phosphotransferase system component IIC
LTPDFIGCNLSSVSEAIFNVRSGRKQQQQQPTIPATPLIALGTDLVVLIEAQTKIFIPECTQSIQGFFYANLSQVDPSLD